jgi:uncharacterized membrane protein (GlpM family)
MDWQQLVMRFVLGGGVVLAATLVADATRNPYVAGIMMTFPALLLAGAVALFLAGYSPQFIGSYFLGTLMGLLVVAVFSTSTSFLVRWAGFWPGIGLGLFIWLGLAASVAFLRLRLHL